MSAIDNPVIRKYSKKEINTGDIEVGQRGSVNLDDARTESEFVIGLEEHLDMDALAELKFMEDPVTIMIQAAPEKYAAKVVDCWVNGRGAEIFDEGSQKWMVCGWLPIGQPVTTRRKYVEVLARAKPETVTTEIKKYEDREDNRAHRSAFSKYPFSVLRDSNPRGSAWLIKIINEV